MDSIYIYLSLALMESDSMSERERERYAFPLSSQGRFKFLESIKLLADRTQNGRDTEGLYKTANG